MYKKIVMTAAMVAVTSGGALAMDGGTLQGKGHGKGGACRADVERLCPGVQPGEGRILACMKEREQELSPACREEFAAAIKRHRQESGGKQGGQRGCRDDVERFCSGVQQGEGRIVRCLKEHEAELSPGCRTSLERRPGRGAPQEGKRMGRGMGVVTGEGGRHE